MAKVVGSDQIAMYLIGFPSCQNQLCQRTRDCGNRRALNLAGLSYPCDCDRDWFDLSSADLRNSPACRSATANVRDISDIIANRLFRHRDELQAF